LKFILGPLFFVYKLWIGLVFWLSLFLLYLPFVWIYKKRERYGMAFRLKIWWGRWIRRLLFCPIKITQEAELPEGGFIVVANHGSYLDTVFMYEVLDRPFLFVGKGELLSWPLFNLFFRKQDIPIRRGQTKGALIAMERVAKKLRSGMPVAIYPEGTIPDDAPNMLPFKNGAFKVAFENNVPVVPITFKTNYKILLDPAKIFQYSSPTTVKAVIHKPIYSNSEKIPDVLTLRNTVRSVIDNELNSNGSR
jgi:1-acyl-sn-glycerol-3-phosphate acyltransferase